MTILYLFTVSYYRSTSTARAAHIHIRQAASCCCPAGSERHEARGAVPVLVCHMICKNCNRWDATPFKHSFTAALDQTKNQSWQTAHGWIVTPTSAYTPSLADTVFCSGDCLFSYLFNHDLLSNKTPDVALHFFKRTDEQRPYLASQQLTDGELELERERPSRREVAVSGVRSIS